MSNDVHLSFVNKLRKSKTEDAFVKSNQRLFMLSNSTIDDPSLRKSQHSQLRNNEVAYKYSSNNKSTCGIQQQQQQQQMLRQEVESSPDNTQRDTNESDNNISSCSTLDIVNKMDNVTLQHLETQVRELSQRLRLAETERADMQHQLKQVTAEKELCFRRMEVISTAHECRITEMHCVIAELSKKLRAKQENTIIEEQELEGSEISYQECSVYNSQSECTNPDADAECQTDPLEGQEADMYVEVAKFGHPGDDGCKDLNDDLKLHKSALNKGQVEALQEEVLHLKAQIALLQSEIANSLRLDQPVADNYEASSAKELRNNNHENEEKAQESCNIAYHSGEDVEVEAHEKNFKDSQDFYGTQSETEILTSTQQIIPFVTKMAERVKLREKYSASTLEQEAIELQDFCNSTSEEIELRRQVEQLKVDNTILSLTLDECKEHCEHLYLLCGKYESNAIGLQLAVNCSDRAIEAYDVMLALLESKLALMLNKSTTAEENRKAVESVARHLLDRLESEKEICENSLGPWQNTFSIIDKKDFTPWTTEDDNRLRYHVSKLKACRATMQNTIVQLESPFSDPYEKTRLALENVEQQGKMKKVGLNTHKELEMAVLTQELLSLHDENVTLRTKLDNSEREHKYAVQRNTVLQDLLGQLQMQMSTMAAATNATVDNVDSNTSQTTTSDSVLFEQQQKHKDCQSPQHIKHASTYTDNETENAAALAEQQLIEALTRENELKGRIQTLIASIAATQKLSDEKHEELNNAVCMLQKSNQNLTQLLEHNKRKYHLRMRRLEQRIMELSLGAGCQQKADNLWEYKNMLTDPQTDNVPETTL